MVFSCKGLQDCEYQVGIQQPHNITTEHRRLISLFLPLWTDYFPVLSAKIKILKFFKLGSYTEAKLRSP